MNRVLIGAAGAAIVLAGNHLATAQTSAGAGAGYEIAITVDDLPWTGAEPLSGVEAADQTRRLLAAFAARGVVATGFVICAGLAQHPGLVEGWLAEGHGIGSHSGRHGDLDAGDLAAWVADVRDCDRQLRARFGPIWLFRYPLLHQGATAERRAAGEALLAELGYRNAHVSVDNAEWVVAQAWAATPGDAAARARIADLYVEHMLRSVAHAREVARLRFGREVRQVLLLHANALNAAQGGALLDALAADGARFITLDSALADAVYAMPDGYTGPRGLSWLYRAAPARPDLAAWDAAEEARLRAALAAIAGR